MKRKALIIGSPFEKVDGDNYLPGVEVDLQSYRDFLMSPLGGGWRGSEVSVLRNPSKSQVQVELNALKTVDYSFAVFCGHGEHDKAKNATLLHINQTTTMTSDDLRHGANKHSAVFDCCREVSKSEVHKALAEQLEHARALDLEACRRLFDVGVAASPSALTVLWACSVGERAGDDSANGGVYSYSLLDGAAAWAKSKSSGTSAQLSIVSAHDNAVPNVVRVRAGRQMPMIEKQRSGPYPPFAVVA